ncbi:MAG: hypoxanthine phosphoribosyltransferase [Alphaproteobacteria bacterium]|nr:hypoxanthine phosphoribosyltransferase [Alphaproteobacteria bacterium]
MSVRPLYSEAQIAARIDGLARDIAAKLPPDFTIVGLLTGCFVFVADLIRALDRTGLRPQVSFIRLNSYGKGKESSRLVRLTGDIPEIAGRNVLLVDDIVDTGRTQLFARNLLREHGAAQVWACALLDKPQRREVETVTEFIGFSIPNVFVVGYGIDYAEQYRHLPYIGVVD